MIYRLVPFLFYLFGLQFFFFPNFWVEGGTILKESIGITMTERNRKHGWYSIVFFGGFFSLIAGCFIVVSYAMEILNLTDFKYLPVSIKMFSFLFTGMLIITGMICYYTLYRRIYIVKKDEDKSLIVNVMRNKIFRVYCVFLILIAPILGILSVKIILMLR